LQAKCIYVKVKVNIKIKIYKLKTRCGIIIYTNM